jgi:hypothetical protein
MKLTIEVRDDKADFILELLRNFSFVKMEEGAAEKARILEDLKGAVSEVNRAKRGEVKLQTARELLNEL